MQVAALIGIGVAVAFVAGGLGIGGGILTVPILYYYGRYDGIPVAHVAHMAVAVSLAIALITNLSAAVSYIRQGRVRLFEGALLACGSMIGAFAASRLALAIPTDTMALLFGVGLLGNGLVSLRDKKKSDLTLPGVIGDQTKRNPGILFALPWAGLLVGALAGTTGIGGGVIMVPLFTRLTAFPVKNAIATSSACIVVTSLAGTIGFVLSEAPGIPEPSIGLLYLPYAVPLSIGALVGGYLGASVSGRTRPRILTLVFAIIQIAAGAKLLYDVWL